MKDASLNARINGVQMPDGQVVPWAVAFPRPELRKDKP
jgi:hypothetical protein